MQRYDALLEDDPEGGWVHYEDVQDLLAECDAIVVSTQKRVTEKETIIRSLRTSLSATNDTLKERIRFSNQLFKDFEVEQRHSDRLHARIGGLYSIIAVSVLANIALAVTFYLEIVGDIIGKIN